MRRIPNEGTIPDGVRRRLEPLAKQHGVTVERIVEVVRARRNFRKAAFYRKRARGRALKKNRFARKFNVSSKTLLSGEGELHGLLKAIGLSEAEFCQLAGIDRSVFYRWYGFPLAEWPRVLLLHYGWAMKMATFLASKGWDPEKFRPEPPPLTKAGRYPRKDGDLKIQGV